MDKVELCQILVKWLATFQIDAEFSTLKDLSDGVAVAQVCLIDFVHACQL